MKNTTRARITRTMEILSGDKVIMFLIDIFILVLIFNMER